MITTCMYYSLGIDKALVWYSGSLRKLKDCSQKLKRPSSTRDTESMTAIWQIRTKKKLNHINSLLQRQDSGEMLSTRQLTCNSSTKGPT